MYNLIYFNQRHWNYRPRHSATIQPLGGGPWLWKQRWCDWVIKRLSSTKRNLWKFQKLLRNNRK